MSEVYLLDGSCFIYRAYHAIRGLSTSKGIPTNAIYGFTRMLLKLIKEKKVQYILIAFDSPHPTKRHIVFDKYKITRPETPKDLPVQIEYIKEIVDAFGIKRMEIQGYEADDIIASMVANIPSLPIYIVSLDKDMLQLVSDRVKIYDPFRDKVIDRDEVQRKYGIPPEKLTDFMALVGDNIDNIPGVKGIGEKLAADLIRKYGSIEEIIRNLQIIKPQRIAELLRKNLDSMRLSKELIELETAAPIDLNLENLKIGKLDPDRLIQIFQELEFKSLLREILADAVKKDVVSLKKVSRDEFFNSLKEASRFAILSWKSKVFAGTNYHITEFDDRDSDLKPLFKSDKLKILHNAKDFIKKGYELVPPYFDTMISAYLVNPNKGKYDIDELFLDYLGQVVQINPEENMDLIFKLYEKLDSELREKELYDVYFKIELPLVEVLADMELKGIKVNVNRLEELKKQISSEIEKTKERIYLLAGTDFNINSPRQLAEILYDKLGLKSRKRGKKSRSTEMEILEELSLQHELPQEIINYRILNKLLKGYLIPIEDYINPVTKRIHTKWSQTVAGTGRIVSSEPNLQNIPVKGQWAELLREVFVPEEGYLFLSADYSQIELRILAHLSEDPSLIKAFKEGKDIHKATASEIFSIKEDEVTEEHRRIAKTVNFGISYGISAFGLSESIRIPYEKAQELIDLYFLRYPKIKNFIENTIEFVKQNGYIRTYFGRIRPIPDINSPNQFLRQQAERIAVNSMVQGTAADIIKIAMIRIYERIRQERLKANIVLQIHDEIVLEVVGSQIERVSEIVKREMTDFNLRVPLELNIHIGENLNV